MIRKANSQTLTQLWKNTCLNVSLTILDKSFTASKLHNYLYSLQLSKEPKKSMLKSNLSKLTVNQNKLVLNALLKSVQFKTASFYQPPALFGSKSRL
jgi:hypothetical protein